MFYSVGERLGEIFDGGKLLLDSVMYRPFWLTTGPSPRFLVLETRKKGLYGGGY